MLLLWTGEEFRFGFYVMNVSQRSVIMAKTNATERRVEWRKVGSQGDSFDRCQRVNCEASPLSAAIDRTRGARKRGKREGKKREERAKKEIKEETGRKGKTTCVLGEERRWKREAADKATRGGKKKVNLKEDLTSRAREERWKDTERENEWIWQEDSRKRGEMKFTGEGKEPLILP